MTPNKCIVQSCTNIIKDTWTSDVCPICYKSKVPDKMRKNDIYLSTIQDIYFQDWEDAL